MTARRGPQHNRFFFALLEEGRNQGPSPSTMRFCAAISSVGSLRGVRVGEASHPGPRAAIPACGKGGQWRRAPSLLAKMGK
eukprot:10556044-Karenia_brevis.AAC.1